MEGFLMKQGVRGPVKSFKRRWFKQKGMNLYYYKTKDNPVELGSITISDALSCERSSEAYRDGKIHFQINTPKRIWHLCSDTEEQAEYWVSGISNMIQPAAQVYTSNRRSVRLETMENRIRDLEIKQTILENALEFAAQKLGISKEELLESSTKAPPKNLPLLAPEVVSVNVQKEKDSPEVKSESVQSEPESKISEPVSSVPSENASVNGNSLNSIGGQSSPPNSNSTETGSLGKPFKAKVLYNYTAQQDYEMTIMESEIITVLSIHGNGWWLGSRTNGFQGYFPGSYVDPLPQ